MPQYTFRIRVDPNPNAGSRIIGDVFRSQIQGEADEVTVESLQPVASPSIKNNKLGGSSKFAYLSSTEISFRSFSYSAAKGDPTASALVSRSER